MSTNKTDNDEDNSLCRFLLLVDTGGNRPRPWFVMAKDGREALLTVMADVRNPVSVCPELRIQTHIVGDVEIAAWMPNAKEIAWRYWWEGVRFTRIGHDEQDARDEFEARWQEHGTQTGPHE